MCVCDVSDVSDVSEEEDGRGGGGGGGYRTKSKKTHVNVGNKNPTRQCGKKSTVRALRAFQVNIM